METAGLLSAWISAVRSNKYKLSMLYRLCDQGYVAKFQTWWKASCSISVSLSWDMSIVTKNPVFPVVVLPLVGFLGAPDSWCLMEKMARSML